MSGRPAQYTERVDAVVYDSPTTASFGREDWIRLALAALDQAGASVKLQKRVEDMIEEEG